MIRLGAHLSISGGYTKALDRIKNIGGNCLQIFSASPRGWNFAKIDGVQTVQFIEKKIELKIDPIYFHASYLINLADEGKTGHLSKLSLISELTIAPKLHIKGSIIHLGSFKTKRNQLELQLLSDRTDVVVNHIKEILEKTPENSLFIIENAGNNKIGKDMKEIAEIIKRVNHPRIRVCLDTCHLYSAGYDLSTPKKLEDFLYVFDRLIGLKKLEAIHANDSKDLFNSGRDLVLTTKVPTKKIWTY